MRNVQISTPILKTAYFPPIAFFVDFVRHQQVFIEAKENYQKRSWRNRCQISGPNGLILLSVPLIKGKNAQMQITEVEIAFQENWQNNHWHSIQTAYGKTPFFEHYAEEVKSLVCSKESRLFLYNLEIIRFFHHEFQFNCSLELTSTYSQYRPNESLNHDLNHWPTYPQPFIYKQSFHPNLSILDLLFCKGPEAVIYIEEIAQLNIKSKS